MPIDIDIHAIPENPRRNEPAHIHFDFRYIFHPQITDISEHHGDHQHKWLEISSIREKGLSTLIEKLYTENIS